MNFQLTIKCGQCGAYVHEVSGNQQMPMNVRVITKTHTCECGSREVEVKLIVT